MIRNTEINIDNKFTTSVCIWPSHKSAYPFGAGKKGVNVRSLDGSRTVHRTVGCERAGAQHFRAEVAHYFFAQPGAKNENEFFARFVQIAFLQKLVFVLRFVHWEPMLE